MPAAGSPGWDRSLQDARRAAADPSGPTLWQGFAPPSTRHASNATTESPTSTRAHRREFFSEFHLFDQLI